MNKRGMFQGPETRKDRIRQRGIQEIDLTPEIRQRQHSVNGIRYDELMNALAEAHKNGRGLAVNANIYWEGWKDRSIYMSLRRLGQRHNISIRSNRSRREEDGIVYLWLDENEVEIQSPRRGPGRPKKTS